LGKTRTSACHQFDHTSWPRDLEMAQFIKIRVKSKQLWSTRGVTGSNVFCVRMRGAVHTRTRGDTHVLTSLQVTKLRIIIKQAKKFPDFTKSHAAVIESYTKLLQFSSYLHKPFIFTEVLTAVAMHRTTMFFWVLTPCNLKNARRFRRIYCIRLQTWRHYNSEECILHFSYTYYYIIFLSVPGSPNWALPSEFSSQSSVRFSSFSHARYKCGISYSPFRHCENIRWRVGCTLIV
jgi:hypothetical protein